MFRRVLHHPQGEPPIISSKHSGFYKVVILFQINPPDATISQVYYLTFTLMYRSTCFGRPHAHHQELNICSSTLWFYRWSVVVVVLLFVGQAGRPACPTTNSTVTSTLQR